MPVPIVRVDITHLSACGIECRAASATPRHRDMQRAVRCDPWTRRRAHRVGYRQPAPFNRSGGIAKRLFDASRRARDNCGHTT